MPAQDDIERQQQILNAHRATLAHYLIQQARLGADYAPPGVTNGIAEARVEIRRYKSVLRSWGVDIEDLPDDEDTRVVPASAPAVRSRPWFWSISQKYDIILDPEVERRNRQTLIADMRLRIKERLDSAPKLIPMRLAERAGVVEPPGTLMRPYDLMRRQPGQPDELLPARTKIADLYAEHNRQLLILGAPGAGKTFLLHELARDLVDVAARDEAAPIPVIFSLASWQPGQSIDVWLVADLARRFGTKPDLFARLLHAGALLPLLDGLDEVATPELRIQCVAAINAFRQSQHLLPPLVVTCREREYADLPPLHVNAAIAVQPLALAQIDRYLGGPTFEALRAALRSDAQLLDLARTPLMLGLLAATYRDRTPTPPADDNAAALRSIILVDYIGRCLAPAEDAHVLRVPAPKLRAFLGWLAIELIAHDNQQDFYLEFLQLDWLPSLTWRWLWIATSVLVVGLVVGLISGLLFGLSGLLAGGLLFGLVGVLVGIMNGGVDKIISAETLTWSLMRFRSRLRNNLFIGLVGGLVAGLIFGLFIGVLFALGFGLLSGLANGIQSALLSERATLNQGIRRTMRIALIVGLIVGLVGGLLGGLLGGLFGGLLGKLVGGLVAGLLGTLGTWLGSGLVGGLVGGLIFGLVCGLGFGLLQYGGATVVKHYVLRLLLPLSTPAPLNFARWLEEARMRGLLVRVGGGYRFYHELLQRHFAANAAPGISRVPILSEPEHTHEFIG